MKRPYVLLTSLILILFFIITMNGCMSHMPHGYTKVPEGQKNYVLKGFSLAPPQGEEWYVQMLGESSISFSKKLEQSKNHTYIANIVPFDLPVEIKSKEKFKELVYESLQIQIKESSRFEIIKYEIALDNRFGEYSVMAHDVEKDYQARNMPHGANHLIMDTYSFYIKHPTLNKYFRIAYSERSLPGEISKTIMEDAQRFFDSVQLITKEN